MGRTQTVTILFCDLVASTERRARLGDDAFDDFTAQFLSALRDAIARHGGREVKSAGDGLMVVFPDSVADAAACAVDMHRAMARLDPDDPVLVRIGISTGEVAIDGSDYSGMPIVEAARLEAQARPGQTLANAVVQSLVGTRRALRFRDVGLLTLKGLPRALAAVEVVDTDVVDAPTTPAADAPPAPTAPPAAPSATPSPPRRRHGGAIAVVAAVTAIAIAVPLVLALRPDSSSQSHAVTSTTARVLAGSTPRGYTPKLLAATCPHDVLTAEPKTICQTLVVPQNRDAPSDGHVVRMLVTEAPARAPRPHAVPTIDVCGCEDVGTSLARAHAALLHVAQRGWDGSDPMLTCPGFAALIPGSLARRSDDPGELATRAAALASCEQQWKSRGVDPDQFNYVAAARDLLDLMSALHIVTANFVAFESAGAEVFEVLREAPTAVRSITLDNPSPPGVTTQSDPIGDLQHAFDHYVALCEAQPRCHASFPGLAARVHSIVTEAQRDPKVSTVANPSTSSPPALRVLMDGHREIEALTLALTDPRGYSVIASAIAQPGLDRISASLAAQRDTLDANAAWGALMSYTCSYDFHTADPSRLSIEARTTPDLVGAQAFEWPHWCAAWKVADVSPTLSRDVVSDVPALIFRGDLNPHGTSDWIAQIESHLTNVRKVVFPTLGLDLLANGPACLSTLRGEFLDDPSRDLRAAASSCAASSPPIAFATPTP